MKKIVSIISTGILGISLLIVPVYVSAQGTGGGQDPNQGGTGGGQDPNQGGTGNFSGTFTNPLSLPGIDTVEGFIRILLENIVIPIGAVLSVVFIIYAGFLYVTARGNPTQISKAHQTLLYAIIGTVIVLGSWAISVAIEGTVDQLRQGL